MFECSSGISTCSIQVVTHSTHVESVTMLCEIIVRQGCAHVGSNLPKIFCYFLSQISNIRRRKGI